MHGVQMSYWKASASSRTQAIIKATNIGPKGGRFHCIHI